jgi:hypothetical protein
MHSTSINRAVDLKLVIDGHAQSSVGADTTLWGGHGTT